METLVEKENTVELHKTASNNEVFLKATAARSKKIMDNKDKVQEFDYLKHLKIKDAGKNQKKFVCSELTTLYNQYTQCYSNLLKYKLINLNNLLKINY